MSYASRAGRARTSSRNPQAHAICDRCGFRYNLVDLQWQIDWRGASRANIRVLVCRRCNDRPQQQLRAITLPADPVPKINARPQDFVTATTDYRTVGTATTDAETGIPIPSTTQLTTVAGDPIVEQPIGAPNGLTSNAISPLAQTSSGPTAYNEQVPVLSITADGSPTLAVTCSSAHGLSTDAQLSFEGLSDSRACGFFSITVTTATAFTYTVAENVPSGSLVTDTTDVRTALVGLPYGFDTIPLTGTFP